MLPPEFEAAYMSAKNEADREAVRRIAGDWCEEQSLYGCAAMCRDEGLISMIWCPAGGFRMGEERVLVTLTHGFWVGKFPVTQDQWSTVMGTTVQDQARLSGWNLNGEGPTFPMYCVNTYEIDEFCKKCTEIEAREGRLPEGWVYALPTEAQWEYACRAGSRADFCFGADELMLGEYAWFAENSGGKTHEVGQKKPNRWGLHDVHGNVWERCRDAWEPRLVAGNDPYVAISQNSSQVFRGGSRFDVASSCRSVDRGKYSPAGRANRLGFRIVLVPSHTIPHSE